mgnify:FL=1
MADSIWVSATGNLGSAQSYSPSGVPIAAGSIAFTGQSSNFDVLSGLTALSGVDLTRVWTQSDYDGDIGADGNPLVTGVKRFIHQGSGSVWYSQEAHASLQSVVVDSPNQQDAFTLVVADVTKANYYFFRNGGVHIADDQWASQVFVGSGVNAGFPIVSIGSNCLFTDYLQNSGYVTSKSCPGVGSFILDGGIFVVDATVTATFGVPVHIAGGTLIYKGSGSLPLTIVSSGTLDMSQDSRTKVISNLILLPGSNYIKHDNVTETFLLDLRGTVPILP